MKNKLNLPELIKQYRESNKIEQLNLSTVNSLFVQSKRYKSFWLGGTGRL